MLVFREFKVQGCTSYPSWGAPVFSGQDSLKRWIQLRSIIGSELCSKSSLACSRWKTTVLFRLESEKEKKKSTSGMDLSSQIIATSHDLTPWWFFKDNPLISGKSRLEKCYNLARFVVSFLFGDVFVDGFNSPS